MPKSVVKLMPEHGVVLPLWDVDDGCLAAEDQYPISDSLRRALMDWQETWDGFYYIKRWRRNRNWSAFVQDGERLGVRLQKELGDRFEVVVQP